MSFANEFDTQWNSIVNFLESEMIKQSDSKGGLDFEDIVRKFENEKKRWSVPGQFNYSWIELLRKKNPEVADEFMNALTKLSLNQENAGVKKSLTFVLISVVCGGAIGLAATLLLKRGVLFGVVATIICGALSGGIANTVYQSKKSKALTEVRKLYVKQLRQMQDILKAVVKKADD